MADARQPSFEGPASDCGPIVGKLNKKYGIETLVLASDTNDDLYRRVTTGSVWFDWTLGGGFAVNQWHEIVGESSSAKTSSVLKTVAANQALDEDFVVCWVAAEPFDKGWAQTLGVDMSRVLLVSRTEMEVVLQVCLGLIESETVDLIVVDSLPALVPAEEDTKDMDEHSVALGARLMSKFFRKNGTAMHRSLLEASKPVTGILINQWRENIGVTWGDNRTAPGGKAKEFFCGTRTELRRGDFIKDDERKLVIKRHTESKTIRRELSVGQEILVKNQKNKTSTPYREGNVDFYFADGVVGGVEFHAGDYDPARETALLARGIGVLEYKGKWRDSEGCYEWPNEDAMMHAITSDERILAHIVKLIQSQ